VRNTDTYRWFQNYSNGSPSINKQNFRSALQALNLPYLQVRDIDSIFDALDKTLRGVVEIYTIDEILRHSTTNDTSEELMERIVRAFNADDNYITSELMKLDN
jgi:Ca2+-binding EF-hand superfamily protein